MEIQTRAACTDALLTWQVREIGGKKVTVFQQESEDTRIASIILRASTTNVLDDLARAVDDGTPDSIEDDGSHDNGFWGVSRKGGLPRFIPTGFSGVVAGL